MMGASVPLPLHGVGAENVIKGSLDSLFKSRNARVPALRIHFRRLEAAQICDALLEPRNCFCFLQRRQICGARLLRRFSSGHYLTSCDTTHLDETVQASTALVVLM